MEEQNLVIMSSSLSNIAPVSIPEPIPNYTSSVQYDVTGEARVLSLLYRKVEGMEQKLYDIETKKIIDETNIPYEILKNNGMLPTELDTTSRKRGKAYRPILQWEIENVKKKTPFASAQARLLNVHLITYRKYAKMYGIYEPHPNVKGKMNLSDPNVGKYPLNKILEGEFADSKYITDWVVKDKLIRSGLVPVKCSICGYSQRRITDNKIALLLDHKDENPRNFKMENLQLLCFNCTFECGRGYIYNGKLKFDPDSLQGGIPYKIVDKNKSRY